MLEWLKVSLWPNISGFSALCHHSKSQLVHKPCGLALFYLNFFSVVVSIYAVELNEDPKKTQKQHFHLSSFFFFTFFWQIAVPYSLLVVIYEVNSCTLLSSYHI